MPGVTTFDVLINNIRCENLSCEAHSRSRNAFLKLNFDNFKTHQTEDRPKELSPSWSDSIAFSYRTRYADCLARKKMTIEVFDRNRFSANELVGAVTVDLHTIATGTVTHRLPLRDGRKHRGTIYVDITMRQVASVEIKVVDVRAVGVTGTNSESIALSMPASGAQAAQTVKSPVGDVGAPWLHADVLFAQGTLEELLARPLNLSIIRGTAAAASPPLASGTLLLGSAFSMIPGQPCEFRAPLAVPAGSAAGAKLTLAPGAALVGRIVYGGFPAFVQMLGGQHTEAGIVGAQYAVPLPLLANKPHCAVEALPNPRFPAAPPAAGGRGGGGGNAPSGPVSRGRNTVTGRAFSESQYAPGSGSTPPPLEDRLFCGAPGLPVSWVRRLVEGPGASLAPLFENLCTGAVEASLPTESEFVVVIPPNAPEGPLGLSLEPNFSGSSRFGWRSGRRNSGYDIGAVVAGITPGGTVATAAAGGPGVLTPGAHLISINGASTLRLTFDETVAALKAARRPMILAFHDPYAVPAPLAAAAANPSATREQLMPAPLVQLGKLQLPGVPSALEGERESGSVGPLVGGSGGGADAEADARALGAEAARTLDLALETMARVGATGPALVRIAGASAGDEAAAAAAAEDATQWRRAVEDPQFHRVLTVAVTGNTGDALPPSAAAAAKRFAAALALATATVVPPPGSPSAATGTTPAGSPLGGSSGSSSSAPPSHAGAEADEDEGGAGGSGDASAAPKPITGDGTAVKALAALAALTATDGPTLHSADSPASRKDLCAELKPTALAAAGTGALRKALDAVNSRSSAAFAGAAVGAVNTIMVTYGLGSRDAGLDQSSLITLQAAARKAEYVPAMAGVGGPALLASLSADHPYQDGAGFLRLVRRACDACAAMNRTGASRARAEDGVPYYVTNGQSSWEEPPAVKAAMSALLAADRASRLLDDAAVAPAPEALVVDVGACLAAAGEDAYAVAALLSCAAKMSAHPAAAAFAVSRGLLPIVEGAAARFPRDARVAECVPALLFNVGRDLDASDALLMNRAVERVCATVSGWMKHYASSTGSPSSFPPEGREAEVNEVLMLDGNDRYARDRNAVRPRLVRLCVNVIINLACYRAPTSVGGKLSVDIIVAAGGLGMLSNIMVAHLKDAAVVTAVLNAAANVAFKNGGVQLALGETMMDSVLLAAWHFASDAALLSMALRTIGNLTNQDANIYRCLGLGAVRMIATAMRAHPANIPLANLAASVLSNIASVEPAGDDTSAAEFTALFDSCWAARCVHHHVNVRATPGEIAALERGRAAGRAVWQLADLLCLEEGAVGELVAAMSRHSSDVATVETCLRTLTCILGQSDVTAAEAVSRVDVVGRTLFVMRAVDYDVGVQAAGCALLGTLAGFAGAPHAAVAGSDAALSLCMAVETHKGTLISAMSGACSALASQPPGGEGAVLGFLASVLEGKPTSVMTLLVRAYDALQLITCARTTKALSEMGTPGSALSILNLAAATLKAAGTGGVNPLTAPVGTDAVYAAVTSLATSAALALSSWIQAPPPVVIAGGAGGGPPPGSAAAAAAAASTTVADTALAVQPIRRSMLSSDRALAGMVRLLDACVTGTGQAGDPARAALHVKPARAVVDLLASMLLASPALPGRTPAGYISKPGVPVTIAPDVAFSLVRMGIVKHAGALLLAYITAVVAGASVSIAPVDPNVLSARLLSAQLLVLLDGAASVLSPNDPELGHLSGGEGGDVSGGNEFDPLSMAAGMTAAAAQALSVVSQVPGTAQMDIAPPPTRLSDLRDLALRVSTHLAARLEAGAAAVAASGQQTPQQQQNGGEPAGPPFVALPAGTSCVPENEATAIFSYSLTRARQLMVVRAHELSSSGGPGAAARKPGAPPPPPGSAAATAAAGGGKGGSPLKRQASIRGLLGKLAHVDGWGVTVWLEGKPHEAIAKASDDAAKVTFYDKKGKPKTRFEKLENAPVLCTLRSSAFASVRVGERIKAGKTVKSAGLFSKGANPKRAVCLDAGTGSLDTLLQMEAADEDEAKALVETFQALADIAHNKGGALC